MKWLIPMLIGSLSGWLIVSVTDEVAIAVASGAAIGILATIALFGTRPARSVVKWAAAMAVGCLFGWLVSSMTGSLRGAMLIGAVIGVLATLAVTDERPALSLAKIVGTMAAGFVLGWGIGYAVGDHRIGMALIVPLGLPLLLLWAEPLPPPRHRPF